MSVLLYNSTRMCSTVMGIYSKNCIPLRHVHVTLSEINYSIVSRFEMYLSLPHSVLTQQCCYDENGLLLVDPKEAHLSIGTPLYQDTASMVAYYRDTVLPFIYCCKEGVTTDQSPSQCRDYQSKLPVNTGSDGLRSEPHPLCVTQVEESGVGKRSVRSIVKRFFNFGRRRSHCGCSSPSPSPAFAFAATLLSKYNAYYFQCLLNIPYYA